MAKSFIYKNLMYSKYSVSTKYTEYVVILSLTPWLSLLTPDLQGENHLIFSILFGYAIVV